MKISAEYAIFTVQCVTMFCPSIPTTWGTWGRVPVNRLWKVYQLFTINFQFEDRFVLKTERVHLLQMSDLRLNRFSTPFLILETSG